MAASISVIIVDYNAGPALEECVASLINLFPANELDCQIMHKRMDEAYASFQI